MENSLMMSHSLVEREPQVEEHDVQQNIATITCSFNKDLFILGVLNGFSLEKNITKLDIKTNLIVALEISNLFIKKMDLYCTGFEIELNKSLIQNSKSFDITSFKIYDVNFEKSMCVVGLDLLERDIA